MLFAHKHKKPPFLRGGLILGGETMKKRKDGRYKKQVTLGGKSYYIYGYTKQEIEDKARELQREHEAGLVIGDATTVGEWATQWFETYKADVRMVTRQSYATIYNAHIMPLIGKLRLQDVRPAHLQAVLLKVSDKSESLQSKVLIILRQLFRTARQNRLITFDPTEGLKIAHKAPAPKTKHLSPEQREALLLAVTDPKARAFVALCLLAGLRREEALGLQWGDIDDAIHVRRAVTFVDNDTDPDLSLKSRSAYRSIPIMGELAAILAATPKTAIWVVPSATGRAMTKSAFRRMWQKVEAAVPFRVTPHMLRHTFASICHAAGVDLKTAQVWMGHSTIAVTANIYTHLDAETHQTEAAKVTQLLLGGSKAGQTSKK